MVMIKFAYFKKNKYCKVVLGKVFIKKLGNQLVLFIKELKDDENGNLTFNG
ncbi:MAG: hypothetical protein ACTSPY_16975 [Candidatus Helarchaeota archaeon]